MPTNHQTRRIIAIACYGRTCMYCGSTPLHRRALYLDPLFGEEGNVPTCKPCRDARQAGDAAEFLQERLRNADAHAASLRAVTDRYLTRAATEDGIATSLDGWK